MALEYKGPVVLVVMDGVGLTDNKVGNAVEMAYDPVLKGLMSDYPMQKLHASGAAVGTADGDMGNSEVGHYTMGSGQIIKQGVMLVEDAFESGRVFSSSTWRELIENVNSGDSQLHFVGLLSDGNVHSNIGHLLKMIERAKEEGVKKVRVHVLLDGRDVESTSALKYVDMLEDVLGRARGDGFDYRIASGGGRTFVTMDRYGSDWAMVERGWKAHVLGDARKFASAREAIETFRKEEPGIIDQYLPPFVIADGDEPIGYMADGDSVMFFNFRADRAVQFSEAMISPEFDKFDRQRVPKVYYAGLVEYDKDRHIPEHIVVEPAEVKNTLAEYLVSNGMGRFVISESVKFGHVTFYFNGNKVGRFSDEIEEYVDIPNKTGEPWQFPWMKSDELTDILVDRIEGGKFKSCLVNYPNGDMVGHMANMESSIVAVEAVDIALGRLMKAVDKAGGVMVVTADHGNIEENFYLDESGAPVVEGGKPEVKTSHTTNLVPFIIYDNTENKGKYRLKDGEGFGLANIAATIAMLHGLEPKDEWEEALIELK